MRTGKGTRNQALDIVRLVASFLVILIHAPLPGTVGIVAESISRVSVPLFFMISGYYSNGKSSQQMKEKTRRTAIMLLWSMLLYFAWEIAWSFYHGTTEQKLRQYFSVAAFVEVFVLNMGIWLGHLWFLLSLLYCYILYNCFLSRLSVGTKKAVSTGLIVALFLLRELLKSNGIVDTTYYTRNFLFTGVPFFLLGDIISQKRHQLSILPLWLQWILLLVGMFAAIAERLFIGCADMYLGTVISAVSLFLLVQDRQISVRSLFSSIGKAYAGDIYIFHVMVIGVVNMVASVAGVLYSNVFLLLRPLLVLCLCIAVASIKGKAVRVVNTMR